MKSMDLGCGVGSGRNSEDVFYVSATLNVGINFCKVDTFQNGILKQQQQQKRHPSAEIQNPTNSWDYIHLLDCFYVLTRCKEI